MNVPQTSRSTWSVAVFTFTAKGLYLTENIVWGVQPVENSYFCPQAELPVLASCLHGADSETWLPQTSQRERYRSEFIIYWHKCQTIYVYMLSASVNDIKITL